MLTPHRLRAREKIAFGFGDFASCIYWTAFANFLLIFYTDVFGIEARVAGSILLWSRILDGLNDPMIGLLADRTRTRWGNFRPYLLWICVPFAIAGALCFTTPDFETTDKVLWAWITYNLLMVLYTAINIPYNSLLAVITPNSIERTSVASYKFFFAFGAGLFVKATLPLLTKWFGDAGANPQRGYQLTFVCYGLIAIACFLIAFFGTRERVRPPRTERTPLRRDLLNLVTNRPWLILSLTTVGFVLFCATRDTIAAYYVKYYIGEQEVSIPFFGSHRQGYEAIVAGYLGLGAIGSLLGVLLTTYLARQIGKKATFTACLLISAVLQLGYYIMPRDQLLVLYGLQIVSSIVAGPLAVLLWAMYADTADFWEWKTGQRATGLVFSASTMTQKFAWAVSGKAAGDMLHLTGFVPNAVAQTPQTLQGMIHMMSTVPAAFGVLAVVMLIFYPLNERTMSGIATELEARRRRAAADKEPVDLPPPAVTA
jgi:glycoside/pentoside/hexuronide:cation symporter, GPH family